MQIWFELFIFNSTAVTTFTNFTCNCGYNCNCEAKINTFAATATNVASVAHGILLDMMQQTIYFPRLFHYTALKYWHGSIRSKWINQRLLLLQAHRVSWDFGIMSV